MQTIQQLLKTQADTRPNDTALLAPGRKPLTYEDLYIHVQRVVRWMNSHGIHRGDRVAIVLANGPEMASAFLSVASGATSAPLNPSYRAADFDFYLSDLNAKALLIQNDMESPARDVARERDIPILEISVNPEDEAGIFRPAGGEFDQAGPAEFSTSDDTALVLHTSGTTSRPKIVPLTQKNICTSAGNIKTTLKLTGEDRCLNVMPLFHIHGLMAAVLASVAAGGSIVCTPGFQADQFFGWLETFTPTWYTAVPTMHQSVLSQVESNREIIEKCTLRFLRSSSASLPPQVMKDLEQAFSAPMIEAYGMTEASHQMSSNPLPLLPRKPGTVGIAAGPEVGIMDEAGNMMSSGETGEIVIRGENVTLGYENNPSANESAFTNGWFRTGDQGMMDAEGYLSITGRLKEMINRGGEKIAPREVDEAFLDHPDVIQAVAFALPHQTLGEDLGAAIILRPGSNATEKDLREFAFSKLADFKVPSQIVIVDEIPKGPTGKLQRIGLSEKLTESLKTEYAPPSSELEKALAKIWVEMLKLERVGVHDNFFSLGGDSLSAASVTTSIEKIVNRQLHPSIIFRSPTVEQLAAMLEGDAPDDESHLVPMQPNGDKKPLFLVPGHGGDVFTFVDLTRHLPEDQPVYVFRFPEAARLDDNVANRMLKEMASTYVAEMRSKQKDGPYSIVGFCYGGELAFEMAQQLHAQNQKTDLLGIIYAYRPGSIREQGLRRRVMQHGRRLLEGNLREKIEYLQTMVGGRIEKISRRLAPAVSRQLVQPDSESTIYFPLYYPGRITLFRPLKPQAGSEDYHHDPHMGWNGLAAEIELYETPGNKTTIFQEPNVQVLGEQVKRCLDQITETH